MNQPSESGTSRLMLLGLTFFRGYEHQLVAGLNRDRNADVENDVDGAPVVYPRSTELVPDSIHWKSNTVVRLSMPTVGHKWHSFHHCCASGYASCENMQVTIQQPLQLVTRKLIGLHTIL